MDGKRFVFDLQRFTLSETKGDDAVFEAVIDNKTYYGTAEDFKNKEASDTSETPNLGEATSITLLDDVNATDSNYKDNSSNHPTPVLTLSKSCTLDLAGHTLTFNKPIGIQIADGTVDNTDPENPVVTKNILTLKATNGGKIVSTWDPNSYSTKASSSDGGYIKNIKGNRIYAAIRVGECIYADNTEFNNSDKESNAGFVMEGGTIESKGTAVCGSDGCEITIKNNSKLQSTKSSGIYFGHRGNGGSTVTIQDNATIISGSDPSLLTDTNSDPLTDDALNTKLDELFTETFSGKNDTDLVTLYKAAYGNNSIDAASLTEEQKRKLLCSEIYSEMPAIQVGGSLTNKATAITIKGNSKVFYTKPEPDMKNTGGPEGDPTAIYASGNVNLTISGGEITSTGTGVEIRAGELDFTGGTVTSTSRVYSVATRKGSGSTTYGAALAVAQHTTKKSIEVNISDDATAKAPIALAVENPEGNPEAGDAKVEVEIDGCDFESTGVGTAAVAARSADSRSTITIKKAKFTGQVESTFAETDQVNSPGIKIEGEVTVVTKTVNEDGTVTTTETTYDQNSLTFTETWTDAENNSQTRTYVVEDKTWNASKENPQGKFFYLVANTDQDGNPQNNATSKATLAPATDPTTTLELKTTESGLTTLAINLNDSVFSELADTFKTLDASNGDKTVAFNVTGNDKITSILGGKGGDTLTAGANGAALNGGDGADLLIGSSDTTKADTFIFTAGADSIQNYTQGTDIISLGSNLTPATSFDKVSYAGKDYVVSFGDSTTDSLTFKSTGRFVLNFGNEGKDTVSYTQNSIVSGEGVTIGSSYYKSKTFNGNSGDNSVFKTIDGSAVVHAIRITGNSNANLITGSKYGGTLLGGDANDTLVATSVGTYLNGGAEADSLVGFTGGGNVFIYTGGDDKIKNYIVSKDLVSVAAGINIADATVTTETEGSSTNLVIGFDTGDSLTFEGGASSTISLKSGRRDYLFSASSIASASDKSITLTAGYTPVANTPFDAGDTYNNIDASAVSVTTGISIKGNDNGNYIIGSASQASSLVGGKGNDTFKGGAGNDVFFYEAGKDVIIGFNEDGGTDRLSIDTDNIVKAKASSRKLTFTMNNKANTLVFRATDAAPTQISLASNEGYLTKDGVVSLPGTGTKSLKLFSSAKGRIDLNNDSLYSGKGIASVSAADVAKQSVTLVGGSTGGEFTFATNNKKRDGFEYNGGKVTINNYESGKDRLNLGDFTISGFKVTGTGTNPGDVVISLGSGDQNVISLTGAAGSEMLIHQSTNRGNSYSKMVFDETGVVYDKAKAKATSATIWSGMTEGKGYDATAATKLKKIKVRDEAVTGISIKAGGNNTLIDASLAGAGVSLYSGDKNDKFIGSSEADMFVYTKGKDIIQGFGTGDSISLSSSSGGTELALTDAKITSGKKSIKFKFEGGNKNTLTIKPTKNATLSGALHIDNTDYTYGKNFIASDGNVSLTSQFGGTYNLDKVNKNASGAYNYVDGHLVEKKLTFKGTDAAESLVGGQNKTTFKGGGGADSLVGGKGADTFFYAKGDKDTVTIANFDFDNDKLKIAGGTINKIESLESGGVQFAMKNGRGDSPAVGWFKVTTSATATSTGTDIAAKDVLIKANNTYYWFAQSETTLASDSLQSAKVGDLITSVSKISKSQTTGYQVIELNYSTNLIKSEVAVQVKDTLKAHT